jgi:hypothetical protein
MRVGIFVRPKRERTYLGSKKVKIKVKKRLKSHFV